MEKTLRQLTEGQNLILVGNSVELLQHNYGSWIDSFDTVVRFGRGVPDSSNKQAIGQYTDIWVTGWLRMKNHIFFEKSLKLFNRCRIHLDKKPKEPDIPFEHIVMFSDEELKEIFSYVGAENNKTDGSRPSAGFLGILFFLKKCNCQSITLIGFDFFSKRLPIQTGEDYPASWHMPINSIKANPHNRNEKVIVQEWASQGLLKWEVISDLKDEFLELT